MANDYVSTSVKQAVRKRAKGYCEYCYVPSSFVPDFFPIDHINPRVLGGNSEINNLANSCTCCNGNKHDKIESVDPLTGNSVRLFHPRKDFWTEHFKWSEDETTIIGLTQIGRATINLLELNRAENINLRILLQLVGLHPPKEYPKD